MASKLTSAVPVSVSLPEDWRTSWSGWKIWPSLYGIPETDYEAEALAFELANPGVLAADWRKAWKAWCLARLLRRGRS